MYSARTVLVVLLGLTAISAFTIYGPSSWDMSDVLGHAHARPGMAMFQTRVPVPDRSMQSPGRRQYGSSTEISTASSQPHDPLAVIDALTIDVSCAAWNCSCQVLSNMTGANHELWFWGTATKEQQQWWLKHHCKTSPACAAWNCSCQVLSDITGAIHNLPLKFWGTITKEQQAWWLTRKCKTSPAGPSPAPLPLLSDPTSTVDDVCYMILYGGKLGPRSQENSNDDDAWRAFLQTWPKRIKGGPSRVYRVISEQGGKEMGTDGKEAINGSGWVDHTHGIVRLPLLETYDTLAVKSLAMWRYVSRSFVSDGWSTRCAWFVKVDTDSWVNVPLLEARLGCLFPDQAIYTGFATHGLCLGGFYLLSRELVRSVDGWMDSFLVHNNLPYTPRGSAVPLRARTH